LVIGPDAYRSLPALIQEAETGQKGVNVLLSREETYGDINPMRLDENGVISFISIMRGCNNMCSFCVVPFTRGRERSRDVASIIKEAEQLVEMGYKEVTLLGQNVDSYHFVSADGEVTTFAELLKKVAQVSPKLRVRFSTSHPKDITTDVLHAINEYDNICKYIHLPVQSGNTRILQMMNRTYTREWYMHKVDTIKQIIPNCSITSDIITGFCSETDEEHKDTLSIIEYARFDLSYMYAYSERPGTLAARRYKDDVPADVKQKRLEEIIVTQRQISAENNAQEVGKTHIVLVEGSSKKNSNQLSGRTDSNKFVVFEKGNAAIGDYVKVKIIKNTSGTLIGEVLEVLP
jgi:tRNA-2-methylthio-N6-dimethylallyladenosine synthase